MRKGQNPAKQGFAAYQAEKLAVATITYIPIEEGYFQQSWDIFTIHMRSVYQNTPVPFNYTVFDNGSCPEVQQRLLSLASEGWIDWLVLSSHNLGKTGALNWLLGALPNEWICYADSDILFRQGWWDESLKIENAFPNCGMIGAQIVFPDWEVDKGNSTFRQLNDPRYRFSKVKPDLWVVEEYCRGRGISGQRRSFYCDMLLDQVEDLQSGTKAFLGGNSHQQWLARRAVIRQILPLPATKQLSRQEDTYQDQKIDELGYLHLTTTIPYLYHMGNEIDNELLPELTKLEMLAMQAPLSFKIKPIVKMNSIWKILVWFSRRQSTRRMLQRLYNNLYQVLSR